jgi:hypothetical protein
MRTVLLITIMLGAFSAQAQDDGVALTGAAEEGATTVLTFDQDDTIEGSLRTPDGELLEARKLSRHRNLIQVRQHFRRQILRLVNRL